MARGRKSAAELAVSVIAEPQALAAPPAYLTPEQEDVWRLVVSSRAGDQIDPEAFPVVVEYCRAVVSSNQIAAQLDTFDPEWSKSDEGLKRWDKLLAMQDRTAKVIASLSVKLRLSPSTRILPRGAGRNAAKGAKFAPWEGAAIGQ